MTRKLMLGAALSALMMPMAAPAQTPGAQPMSPPAAQDKTAAPAAAEQKNGAPDFVMSQKPDQWLASKFKGTNVVGTDGKAIGDVTDILFDKAGKIEAYVVSIGGFLGMGSKQVALAPSSFEVVPGTNGSADKLKLAVTQDELKQAQNFTPYAPPHATTTGSAPKPMGSSRPPGMGR